MMAKPMKTLEYNSTVNQVRCGHEFLLDFIIIELMLVLHFVIKDLPSYNGAIDTLAGNCLHWNWTLSLNLWAQAQVRKCTCTVGCLLLGTTNALQITVVSGSAVLYV